MIQKLKNILLDNYLSWRLKHLKAIPRAHDFSKELREVKQILIVLPETISLDDIQPTFVQQLYEIFGQNVRISTFEKRTFRKEDSTWLGLPKKEYMDIFASEQIDLVIDLNESEDKFCTYVCALLPAPIKVNLAPGTFDHVYNLHIRSDGSKPLAHRLETIIRYFKTLMG